MMRLDLSVVAWCVLITMLSRSESSLLDPILKFIPPKSIINLAENYYRMLGQQGIDTNEVHFNMPRYGRQSLIPDHVAFPCDVSNGRSPERPISVHALRPGDIDVIAAMGDSLSAAFGAKASDILHLLVANRGVAFSAGGEGTWRTALTLPNILKEFNPNLVGYATGDALSWQQPAQCNVAEGAATVQDMPHQAALLVRRMKEDPRIDFEQDWKMITILIGYNDVCTVMCTQNLTKFFEDETVFFISALDVLYAKMPRVLVNVIPPANLVKTFDEFSGLPPVCRDVYQATECSCIGLNKFAYTNHKRQQADVLEAIGQFVEDIPKLDRYKGRADFTVVAQPFNREGTLPSRWSPLHRRTITDYSYFAPDCFHFSQKGHAISANGLWNNLLQPVGRKSRDRATEIMYPFLCPSEHQPYIFTSSNTPPF